MIVRADTGVSFLIEFPSGPPDGNVTWKVRGPDTTVLASGSIVVPNGAVSVYLVVNASLNNISTGFTSYRDVEWTYTVGGAVINGEQRYSLEGRVPFGASAAGVRTKLGIDDPLDLPDNEISLVTAYSTFIDNVSSDALSAADLSDYRIRDAIEASAALALLPTLTVRLAKKEDSGTSSFQRQDIDWMALAASLNDMVIAGYLTLDPTFDPTSAFGAIFILASPATDAFTGA